MKLLSEQVKSCRKCVYFEEKTRLCKIHDCVQDIDNEQYISKGVCSLSKRRELHYTVEDILAACDVDDIHIRMVDKNNKLVSGGYASHILQDSEYLDCEACFKPTDSKGLLIIKLNIAVF